MSIDRVKPLKIENPAEGGTQTDMLPTEVNASQDYIAAKGLALSDDPTKLVDLDISGNIQFTDVTQTSPVTVTDLKTASQNTFDNSSNGFAATNVQAAIEEARSTSSATNFSYNVISSTITIPVGQQMVVYQELEITLPGELVLNGELTLIE